MNTRKNGRTPTSTLLLAIGIGSAGIVSCDGTAEEFGVTTSPIQGGVLETGFPAVGIVQNSTGLCSGTLVSRNMVLTAAHCIGTGMVFKTGNSVQTAVSHAVAAVIRDGSDADEALLRLAQPIANITPMAVSRSGPPAVNVLCTAVGFGLHANDNGSTTVGVKRSGTVRVIGVSATQISTQFETAITDSGDSGGPLICNGVIVANTSSHNDGVWPAHRRSASTIVRKGWFFGRVDGRGDVNASLGTDIALVGASDATTIPVAFSNGIGGFNVTNTDVATFAGLAAQPGAKPVSGDFNFDGRSDIALVGGVGWSSIPVAFSNGNGSYATSNLPLANFPLLAQTAGAEPVAGDFNGDGRGDIALVGGSGWSSVPVAIATGNGTFTMVNVALASFPGLAANPAAKPVAGDFNGDGFSDIALLGVAGWTTIPFALSNGGGTFTFREANGGSFIGSSASGGVKAVSGDFNGDGKTDLALTGRAEWTTIPIATQFGQQANLFFQFSNPSVTTFPDLASRANVKAIAGDFNKDGVGDIALTGGSGWTTIPVAFGQNGAFTVTNQPVVSFPALAANPSTKPVGAY